jgi:hypothetical protein
MPNALGERGVPLMFLLPKKGEKAANTTATAVEPPGGAEPVAVQPMETTTNVT